MRRLSLLAVLAAMAIVPASASAAGTIAVNRDSDGPLGPGNECASGETCTLRAAVERADDESASVTIELPAGSYELSEGELWVEDGADVTLQGAGTSATTVQGDGSSGVLSVEDGGHLTVRGLTVSGGDSSEGGGLYAEFGSVLNVEQSAVTKNEGEIGGGIFGEQGASVNVTESSVTGNSSFAGGGIAVAGECYVEVEGKPRARHATHRLALAGPFSGGLSVSRSSVEGNEAELGGGIVNLPYCTEEDTVKGSERSSASPAIVDEQEDGMQLEQSSVSDNRAFIGGGVLEETFYAEDPIVDSTLADNLATYTGGGLVNVGGEGVLVSDTVSDNQAEGSVDSVPSAVKAKAHRLLHRASRPLTDGEGEGEGEEGSGEESPQEESFNEEPEGEEVVPVPIVTNLLAFAEGDVDAQIDLRNTIVANTAKEGESCGGEIESLEPGEGFNLDYPSKTLSGESHDTCGMSTADKDLVETDPELDPKGLQPNGGPTDTIALESTSPAIGAVPLQGDCTEAEIGPALRNGEGGVVALDQRGYPRPGIAGDGCDIGAYEYQQPAAEPKPGPEPEPKGEPKTEPKTTTTPATTAQVLGVKIASPVCASKRDITIHIQNVKQFGVVKAIVSIDGKARRTLTGRRLTTAINLRGLPKGTFTVSIVAKTRQGQTLHGRRVYHTCHTRLPGHVYLRL